MLIKLSLEMRDSIFNVLAWDEDQSEMIREAISREIKRRQRDISRTRSLDGSPRYGNKRLKGTGLSAENPFANS